MGLGAEGGAAVAPHLDGYGDPEAGGRLERLQRRTVELVHHREHGSVGIGEASHRRSRRPRSPCWSRSAVTWTPPRCWVANVRATQ